VTTKHLTDQFSAIKYYQEACKASPSDPAPLSNLTAALYETGQYEQCVLETETALQLAASKENVDQALVNKLKVRQCKACITLGELDKAIEVVKDEKNLTEDTLSLAWVARNGLAFQTPGSSSTGASFEHLKKIVDVLPRFKPQL
jgi:tetratricopeptide (TPR) repeat protein